MALGIALGVALSLALNLPAAAGAQMHHVDAPERVTRAIGVYEWTGELPKPSAARFVPVSLFIDGRFEDAGLYLARPVPFALQNGNLYTVERSGEPEGALDLDAAERVVSGNAVADGNAVGAWYGFGKFTAEAPPKAAPALHKSSHVGVIQAASDDGKAKADTKAEADDGEPHMTRRSATGEGDSGTDTPDGAGKDQASSGSGSSSGGTGSGGDDTDRPTLARRDPSQDASRKKAALGGKKAGTAGVTAVGPAPGDDPDRPTLSHKTAAEEGPKELTGMPPDLHQAVAVSDPVARDPHPFARTWEDTAERTRTMAALAAIAKVRVAAYLSENKLVPSAEVIATTTPSGSTEGIAAATENGAGAPPKLQRGRPSEYGSDTTTAAPVTPRKAAPPSHTPAKKSIRTPPAAPLLLRNEEIAGFTLSYGGLPTFVYTASVPAASAHPGDQPPAATHPTAFVTLVAQRLPSGELQVALGTVTDSLHLDRGPRLHLVDAVDPDASHRASLLFDMRGGSSRQFALYRLISARAENTFTGASIE